MSNAETTVKRAPQADNPTRRSVTWKWCKYEGVSGYTAQRIVTEDYATFPTKQLLMEFLAEKEAKGDKR